MTYPLLGDPLEKGWTALQSWDPERARGALLAFRQDGERGDAERSRSATCRRAGASTCSRAPTTTPRGTVTSEQLTRRHRDHAARQGNGARVLAIVPSEPRPAARRGARRRAGLGGILSRGPGAAAGGGRIVRDLFLCGRREISLVRADVRGRAVVLSGPGVAPAGRDARSPSTRATRGPASPPFGPNAAGEFRAAVPRPSRAAIRAAARYEARVRLVPLAAAEARPVAQLDLDRRPRRADRDTRAGAGPRCSEGETRSWSSSSCAAATGGWPGRRPDRRGRYVARFDAPAGRPAALFRAESRVLARPGSRRYVKQYARAIGIDLTGQTG